MHLLAGCLVLALVAARPSASTAAERSPEDRALAFLAREVPRWPEENRCYSCHNNGDAARALYTAVRLGRDVPAGVLGDTTAWLANPAAWDENKGNPDFSDLPLARIQFASALVDAIDAGLMPDRRALAEAARLVAGDQKPDGSWRLDSGDSIGSPATYGTFLATGVARWILERGDRERFRDAIALADGWLRHVEVKTVLDAAALVLGLGGATDEDATSQRRRCLEILARGEAPSGGWGAYLNSRAEPFDTGIALLALASLAATPELAEPVFASTQLSQAIARGRQFLVNRQLPDGGWPETTRPAGQRSYAQYISTSGWATLALLATAPR
jgi:hypothetical protein